MMMTLDFWGVRIPLKQEYYSVAVGRCCTSRFSRFLKVLRVGCDNVRLGLAGGRAGNGGREMVGSTMVRTLEDAAFGVGS